MRSNKVFDDVTVNATATVYSDVIDMSRSTGVLAVAVIADDGGGTAEMTVEYEVSHDGSTWDSTNATEIVTGLGSAMQIFQITPPPVGFLRLKATGTGSNPADAAITGHISWVEDH